MGVQSDFHEISMISIGESSFHLQKKDFTSLRHLLDVRSLPGAHQVLIGQSIQPIHADGR